MEGAAFYSHLYLEVCEILEFPAAVGGAIHVVQFSWFFESLNG
jgi:hypothetical protein